MNYIKTHALSLSAFFAMIILSIYFYPDLPDQVATRFDFDGTPLQYSPKQQQAVMMPAIFLILMILLDTLVRISPKKFSMPNSKGAVDVMIFGFGLMMLFVHFGMLFDPTGTQYNGQFGIWGMGVFLIVIGNVFGKTERNFFLGIRAPWTIASTENWKATHRFAGKLMVVVGIALIVTTFFYASLILGIGCIIGTRIAPILYSFRYYVAHEKDKELEENLD